MPFSFKQKQEEPPAMSLLEVALVPILHLVTLCVYTNKLSSSKSINWRLLKCTGSTKGVLNNVLHTY